MKLKYLLFLLAASPFRLQAQSPAESDTTTDRYYNLKEVEIISDQLRRRNIVAPEMGRVTISPRQVKNIPTLFGEADVLKALQTQPGVSSGVEGFTGMYVRGGDNDENLYLLHNLPLYHINHLCGIFSSFNVATLDDVDFYKSSFPSNYGGRLSSITDIRLRESNFQELEGEASIGLLSGSVFVTAPIKKDKVAFSAGMRRSWLDIISAPTIAILNRLDKDKGSATIGRYAFTDLNLKLDYRVSDHISGYTHAFWGSDFMKLGSEHFSETNGTKDYSDKNVTSMRWGNWGISSGFDFRLRHQWTLSANAYFTSYDSNLGQDKDSYTISDGEKTTEYTHKNNKNGIYDLGFNFDAVKEFGKLFTLKTGTDYIFHHYKPERITMESNASDFSSHTLVPASIIEAHEASVYVDGTLHLGDHWAVQAGVRGVYYTSEGTSHFLPEPRAALRYAPSKDLSFKAGYSRMSQFVQQICNSYISLPTDSWQPIGSHWDPLTSDQVSLGVYGNLPAGFFYSVEGYYKWMHNLLEYKEGMSMFSPSAQWSDKLTVGEGTAYGVDISVQRNIGKVTGTVGYGLLWTDRRFAELNNGRPFPSKYDNRHKFNIVCTYRLNDRFEFNAGWTFMTGNLVTLALENYNGLVGAGFPEDLILNTNYDYGWGINYYSTRNNVRLPAYHRLDLGMNVYKTLKNGHQTIWNVGLYNAYSRMNPIAVVKQEMTVMNPTPDKRWNNKFQTMSIMPIIPSVSFTYKF